ncbi:1742_t:CDS:2 [Cetraspora pellucida]|uniref:1742_t:CDS:1 n=1 Tax=Cetraspora pellucida TaxID=1433469 RepID=A0A9N9AKP4_9GLOM|nr:1742_t:CDS:2 [Cetraspora pellucida]
MSVVSWTKLTIKELQNLCETYGLFTEGNKEELNDRLQEYFEKIRENLSEKLQESNIEVRECSEEDVNDFNVKSLIKDKFAIYFQEKDRVEAFLVNIFMSALRKIEKKIDRNFYALHKDLEKEELLYEAWLGVLVLAVQQVSSQYSLSIEQKVIEETNWLLKTLAIICLENQKERPKFLLKIR